MDLSTKDIIQLVGNLGVSTVALFFVLFRLEKSMSDLAKSITAALAATTTELTKVATLLTVHAGKE